jgi:hypothetical protein
MQRIYSLALSGGAVAGAVAALWWGSTHQQNSSAAGKDPAQAHLEQPADPAEEHFFDHHIAPLLARHCLECHDAVQKEGGINLSRQTTSLAANRHGQHPIVPGDADASLIWQAVKADEMPPAERPALSAEERELLRQWIDRGAVWSTDEIDLGALARDDRASQIWIQRLTISEYIETIRAATGVDISQEAREWLPPDLRADGFSNTAYNLPMEFEHVEAFARLAAAVVRKMDLDAFAARFGDRRELEPEPMREWIASAGFWLLRGPLEEHEIDAYWRVAEAVKAEDGDDSEVVSFIIEAMLQSPRFLYRIENQAGDGGWRAAAPFELASRLSYMLWGAPPDQELLDAAMEDRLRSPEQVTSQVERMLDDPRVVERSIGFVRDWLSLDRLDHLRPNHDMFPTWHAGLAGDMQMETIGFFREVVWNQGRPLADLMNAQVSFMTPRLARHYGIDAEPSPSGDNGREPAPAPDRSRLTDGLVAMYRFDEGEGDRVRDVAGTGEPIDLRIHNPGAVRWDEGGLEVHGSTLIASEGGARRLSEAVRDSGEITIAVWLTPARTGQSGPARILTLSQDISRRNFTIGQENDRFDARMRTSDTNANGMPGVRSDAGSVVAERMQVVYSRDAGGRTRFFINGELRGEDRVRVNCRSWDLGHRLALANELSGDRPWQGTYHELAVYNRALAPDELLPPEPERYDLTKVPARGGLLTQGSLLTIGGDDASTVTRGLFILHDLLYSAVGSAPPGTDTTPVPAEPGLSRRLIAEQRLADNSCGGCHARFEPWSFAFEKYDGVGSWMDVDEHGNQLREDGQVFFPGNDVPLLEEMLVSNAAAAPQGRPCRCGRSTCSSAWAFRRRCRPRASTACSNR